MVQGELLVSEGDDPASGIHRPPSTLVNSSETTGQIYFKFGQKHPCDSLIWIYYYYSNWPLLGVTRAKNRKKNL